MHPKCYPETFHVQSTSRKVFNADYSIFSGMAKRMQQLTPHEIDELIQVFDEPDSAEWCLTSARFPESLISLVALFERRLHKEGINKTGLSEKLITELALYLGGRDMYIPNGDKIKRCLRDIQIYRSFRGNNLSEIARQFCMTERNASAVIRNINQLARKCGVYQSLNEAVRHG